MKAASASRETVAEREWVIRSIEADAVVMERLPDGGRERFHRSLLPVEVAPGDRFRVVAQLDRRVSGPDGAAGNGDGAGDSRGSELPDALDEALHNLT